MAKQIGGSPGQQKGGMPSLATMLTLGGRRTGHPDRAWLLFPDRRIGSFPRALDARAASRALAPLRPRTLGRGHYLQHERSTLHEMTRLSDED